jgi:hypothetical protein
MRLRLRGKKVGLLVAMAVGLLAAQPMVNAQGQAIFQDDRALMQTDQMEVQQYQNNERQYEQQSEARDASANTYRLYAEKRIAELSKVRDAGGSPTKSLANNGKPGELYALQSWLKNDDATRASEQKHVKQLNRAIVNLQSEETAAMANLPNDIGAMREDGQRAADDDKFNHMMQMNYFNELQSEMGAASWGRPPTDGTYNSVGGYGMQGGYGYSVGGGRTMGPRGF